MRPDVIFVSVCKLCKEMLGNRHYVLDDSNTICHNCYTAYGNLVNYHNIDSYKTVEQSQIKLMRGT